MKKQIDEYQKEDFSSTEREEILEAALGLFQFLDDEPDEVVVKAAMFFVEHYEFNVDFLPERIRDAVKEKIGIDDKDAFHDSVVNCLDLHRELGEFLDSMMGGVNSK